MNQGKIVGGIVTNVQDFYRDAQQRTGALKIANKREVYLQWERKY